MLGLRDMMPPSSSSRLTSRLPCAQNGEGAVFDIYMEKKISSYAVENLDLFN